MALISETFLRISKARHLQSRIKQARNSRSGKLLAYSLLSAFVVIICPSEKAVGSERTDGDLVQSIPIRGVVRPSAKAVISSGLTARIARVGFQEGESFDKGAILIEFDCRRQNAELRSAAAKRREMMVSLKSALFLKRRNANSHQDVETAQARADIATAEVDAIKARLRACIIAAPYGGHVTEVSVHEHETPKPGSALISIASRTQPRIELIVPSRWLTWLKPGANFQYVLDDTGKLHLGIVTRLGATVDTVSQTIKVFARFKQSTGQVLPGMSGTARFQAAGK